MKFLISGYYGYDNAGDEAVLAAMLQALGERAPADTEYIVTSGDPSRTAATYSGGPWRVRPIGRQGPGELAGAISQCDAFISGGGSLLQDVTSLRNVVYYTTLMRVARLFGKPVMVYAQGVGPLRRPRARKLTRIVMQQATTVTLRDPDSLELLRRIGVRRDCEVTADPVWALQPQVLREPLLRAGAWVVNLRLWSPSADGVADEAPMEAVARAIAATARAHGAKLRLLPMQPEVDGPVCRRLLEEVGDPQAVGIVDTQGMTPAGIMAEAGQGELSIAMRLHALIFATAQGLPCVAVNYDPKVAALAKLMGMPLIEAREAGEPEVWMRAVAAAKRPSEELLRDLKNKALHNADLAVALAAGNAR